MKCTLAKSRSSRRQSQALAPSKKTRPNTSASPPYQSIVAAHNAHDALTTLPWLNKTASRPSRTSTTT